MSSQPITTADPHREFLDLAWIDRPFKLNRTIEPKILAFVAGFRLNRFRFHFDQSCLLADAVIADAPDEVRSQWVSGSEHRQRAWKLFDALCSDLTTYLARDEAANATDFLAAMRSIPIECDEADRERSEDPRFDHWLEELFSRLVELRQLDLPADRREERRTMLKEVLTNCSKSVCQRLEGAVRAAFPDDLVGWVKLGRLCDQGLCPPDTWAYTAIDEDPRLRPYHDRACYCRYLPELEHTPKAKILSVAESADQAARVETPAEELSPGLSRLTAAEKLVTPGGSTTADEGASRAQPGGALADEPSPQDSDHRPYCPAGHLDQWQTLDAASLWSVVRPSLRKLMRTLEGSVISTQGRRPDEVIAFASREPGDILPTSGWLTQIRSAIQAVGTTVPPITMSDDFWTNDHHDPEITKSQWRETVALLVDRCLAGAGLLPSRDRELAELHRRLQVDFSSDREKAVLDGVSYTLREQQTAFIDMAFRWLRDGKAGRFSGPMVKKDPRYSGVFTGEVDVAEICKGLRGRLGELVADRKTGPNNGTLPVLPPLEH